MSEFGGRADPVTDVHLRESPRYRCETWLIPFNFHMPSLARGETAPRFTFGQKKQALKVRI